MKILFTFLLILLTSLSTWAQAPQKMSYQAVVRDAGDALLTDTTVGMQISILEGSAGGTAVYVETHTPTTNTNGLATLEVGGGSVVSGDFTTIDWGSDDFYIKSEIDPTGGTSYTIEGTSQLLSVPYALYAQNGGTGSTLDQAYDKEMTTGPTPRIINADDGKIEIIATDNIGLEVTGDPIFSALNVTGSGPADVVAVISTGAGDGVFISNTIGGDGLRVDHLGPGDAIFANNLGGVGDGLRVDQAGAGDVIFANNLGAGGGIAVHVIQTGAGDAVEINNTAGGGGKALLIDQSGAGIGVDININNAGTAAAVDINNNGTDRGINLWNRNVANIFEAFRVDNDGIGGAVWIDNLQGGGGFGLAIDQAGAGIGLDLNVNNTGTNNALDINNNGTGRGLEVWNRNAANLFEALRIDNDGLGGALWVDNLAGGGEFGLAVDQAGAGNAVEITNGGTAIGLAVANTNAAGAGEAVKIVQAAPKTALFVDNTSTMIGVEIFNGNPAGTGEALKVTQVGTATAVFIENAGTGKGAEILTLDPANDETVLFAGTMGTGVVAQFVTDENNAALLSTLQSLNMGAGRVAEFRTVDEVVGKVNSFPTVDVISNGKGAGINVDITNDVFGTDSNTEPAIVAIHRGYGKTALFENSKSDNFEATVEIINKGAGYGLHIDSFDNPGVDVETALYVEQANSSTSSILGRVAVFDLHPAGTSADSAVLIRSSATDPGSSALRVSAASTANLAAVFEGDVEISSDLLVGLDVSIGGTMSATTKLFKIDHPLDPDNKYLIHNSVESNERVNIYNGIITTNIDGYATVQLPDYMCALNKDFKYQLTIVDKSFAQAIIWEQMNTENNSFIIKTNTPEITVSWQITGTRQDTWALENPMQVEVDKNPGL